MTKTENWCVDCGKPCTSNCPHRRVAVIACDRCGEEMDGSETFYKYDDGIICKDCLIETLKDEKIIEAVR